MAYGYQSPYYPNYMDYTRTQPQYQQTAPATTDERIWVQSDQAAEAYLLAPNSFVRLWNSNQPVFYEKRADATGKPFPMEVYEYSRRSVEASNSASLTASNGIDYTEQIKALETRIEALESMKKSGGKANAKSNANDSDV